MITPNTIARELAEHPAFDEGAAQRTLGQIAARFRKAGLYLDACLRMRFPADAPTHWEARYCPWDDRCSAMSAGFSLVTAPTIPEVLAKLSEVVP